MARQRIAILHYTISPDIGGIENLIETQIRVLERLGHDVVVIAGSGRAPRPADTIVIPAIDPRLFDSGGRRHDEHAVSELIRNLQQALEECTACWIHNALTISLNPSLARALAHLIERNSSVRWAAWCADISAASQFEHPAADDMIEIARGLRERVSWITLSRARQQQLAALLGLPASEITVINPPVDAHFWLQLNEVATSVVKSVGKSTAWPVALVPAKAATHKGLLRAVHVAAALSADGYSPRMLLTAAPSPHAPRESVEVVQALRTAIRDEGVESSVFLLTDIVGGSATRETVRGLMLVADFVFVPSLEEGFGMPLLEATLLRAPILCSDIPVFREVAGNAAHYFSVDASDAHIGSLMLELARETRNVARRSALQSLERFEVALARIVVDDH